MFPRKNRAAPLARPARVSDPVGPSTTEYCCCCIASPSDKLCAVLRLPALVAMSASCVYNYAMSPRVMCALDPCKMPETATMIAMFPRAVAVACLLSETSAAYKSYTGAASRYERNLVRRRCGGDGRWWRPRCVAAAAAAYALVVLPTNAIRLYLFERNRYDGAIVLFFALMYAQNCSLCVTEFQFVRRCYRLYREFRSINSRMSALKDRTIVANRYPSALRPDETAADCRSSVALLKSRHRAVSDAAAELNGLYGFRLTVSVSVLFVMFLFDIYEVMTSKANPTKTNFLLYGWLIQYTFRFFVIVMTTHFTTTQAHKSKTLITDINNRYLDENAKYELQLFLNQLYGRPVEFTLTFDVFVLNIRLITSAFVAGAAYFFVLLQFKQ